MWCYWNYVTERYVGYLVRSSKSRKNPYASFARRLREIAQNNAIKVKYQLREELDLSSRREEDEHGHCLPECRFSVLASYLANFCSDPDIFVLHPRAFGPLTVQVQKAIKNYLLRTFEVTEVDVGGCIPDDVTHWGKISFMDGGDKIRAVDLVAHSEHNMTRDASFIKVMFTYRRLFLLY
jgi:hypothetical protein